MSPVVHAVKFPRFGHILFVAGPIPDLLDDALRELSGEVVEGLTLQQPEPPEDPHDWPQGSEAPVPVLAVSTEDPKHYRVFNTAGEANGAGYTPTGLGFAEYNPKQFESFVNELRKLRKIGAQTDEQDTDELWDHLAHAWDRGEG